MDNRNRAKRKVNMALLSSPPPSSSTSINEDFSSDHSSYHPEQNVEISTELEDSEGMYCCRILKAGEILLLFCLQFCSSISESCFFQKLLLDLRLCSFYQLARRRLYNNKLYK